METLAPYLCLLYEIDSSTLVMQRDDGIVKSVNDFQGECLSRVLLNHQASSQL